MPPLFNTSTLELIEENMKTQLPKLFVLVMLLLVLPLRFIAQGSSADSLESLADPGKYSDDWRANGPPGGDVRSLVVDPSNPDRFYLGTLDAQIYTSNDAGKTWQLLYNFNRPKLFVDHIIVDPRDPRTLYVAAHRHKEPGGFFKSTDGGRKWRESSELKNEALHSLIQADADPDVLIAGTFNGIFRSDNSGDSWTQLPTYKTAGLVHVESLAIDPRTANTIYAGTWYLPYKSTDGGQSWKSIKNGIIDDSDIFAIDIDRAIPTTLSRRRVAASMKAATPETAGRRCRGFLLSREEPELSFSIHRSPAGLRRHHRRVLAFGSRQQADSWMVTTSRQRNKLIAIHPSRPETIYIGTNNYGVMVSYDGGKNSSQWWLQWKVCKCDHVRQGNARPDLCVDHQHHHGGRILLCQQ